MYRLLCRFHLFSGGGIHCPAIESDNCLFRAPGRVQLRQQHLQRRHRFQSGRGAGRLIQPPLNVLANFYLTLMK